MYLQCSAKEEVAQVKEQRDRFVSINSVMLFVLVVVISSF